MKQMIWLVKVSFSGYPLDDGRRYQLTKQDRRIPTKLHEERRKKIDRKIKIRRGKSDENNYR